MRSVMIGRAAVRLSGGCAHATSGSHINANSNSVSHVFFLGRQPWPVPPALSGLPFAARTTANWRVLRQAHFEQDFLLPKLTHQEYMQRLQSWRDRYERSLDSRPRTQSLDSISHYLTQFQYSKIDEIEVPGQYTEVRLLSLVVERETDDRAGQGQQSELCSYPEVCPARREWAYEWDAMEAIHHHRQRQLAHDLRSAVPVPAAL